MAEVLGFYGREGPYGCFSNFYYAPFTIDGRRFKWSEQYIMYQKAILFDDVEIANRIMHAEEPVVCKRLGKKVDNFDADVWAAHRFDLVLPDIHVKFEQNEDIKNILLSTGDVIIAECTPRDKVWSCGLHPWDPCLWNLKVWKGYNLQGELLMKVREMLRNKS